jgi:sec-independent protein translocase protein TatA
MPGWIGPWELALLLIVVLLVFGPKRLPEMGKSLGKGMREFKDSITGKDDDDEKTVVVTQHQELPAPPLVAAQAEEPVVVPAKHDTTS